jgi:hypothetical protein
VIVTDHVDNQVNSDLRRRWLTLMRVELPRAAASRPDWPIRLDHCFGRVVLDAVYGRPWRDVLPAPAWRNMDEAALRRAIALGEAVLDGREDLQALNRASLAGRKKLRTDARRPAQDRTP